MTDAERLRERVDAIFWNETGEHDEWDPRDLLAAIVDEAGGPGRVQEWIDALPVPTMPEVDEVRTFLRTLLEVRTFLRTLLEASR